MLTNKFAEIELNDLARRKIPQCHAELSESEDTSKAVSSSVLTIQPSMNDKVVEQIFPWKANGDLVTFKTSGGRDEKGTLDDRKEEEDDDDDDDDDSLLLWSEAFQNNRPCHSWRRKATKSDVLQFLAGAENVRLSKVNGTPGDDDWQVTDESGFPLIDAWHELNFCNKFWRLETCGKTILNMSESLPWCTPLTYHSARSRVNVYDFNGDFYGAILTGIERQQPILILSADRKVVAKIVSPRPKIEKKRITNPVRLDPSSPDMAIIDMDRMRDDSREPLTLKLDERHENLMTQLNTVSSTTSFCPVPLENENRENAAVVGDDIKLICISADDTGRHLAHLHTTDTVWFGAQICLNLKLLILSTFIRLTGGTETAVDIVNLIKYLFTCCANNE